MRSCNNDYQRIPLYGKHILMVPSPSYKPHNFSLSGFIQVTRLWNLLIIVFAQYFTAFFLVELSQGILDVLRQEKLFLLSLSSVLVAAAGYIINDYYDVKIDLINKPKRVVVGKILKRRVAMVAHSVLSIAGISIGFLLSWPIGLINFGAAILLWLYSNQLKRMPLIGNLAVALLTGLSIYVVEVLYQSGETMVIVYTLFAFSFTLIREIIKDVEDLKGDATFGCKTLPVVYGIRKTKNIIYFFSVAFLAGLSLLAYIFVGTGLMLFCLALVIPLGFLAYRLSLADTTKDFNYLSNYCKVIMFLGIVSMIIFK